MPGLTGLDLQRRLSELNGRVPVIFVTAHADDDVRAQALQHGAVKFLRKPFSEDALLNAIGSALNH